MASLAVDCGKELEWGEAVPAKYRHHPIIPDQ